MNAPTRTLFISFMLGLSWLSIPASGVISWDVTYDDVNGNTGFGFDDPTLGGQRRATFESALGYVSSVLNGSGTVDFLVNTSLTQGVRSLASAGSRFWDAPPGFQNGIVYEAATSVFDPLPSTHEGSATFDFGYSWNSGLNAPAVSEFDLFTVSLHEITHALGFSSLLNSNGVSRIGAQTDPGIYTVYDSLLQDGSSNSLFAAGGDFVGDTNDLISANVYFGGTSAVLANGGDPVPIYSPDPFRAGSSLSHVDYSVTGAIMHPGISSGVMKREYLAVELAMLQDIGWELTPIPEPSTILMMGVAVLALLRLRRRR